MRCTYIGNELLAAGFRLAGAKIAGATNDPDSDIRDASGDCDLLVLGESVAEQVSEQLLDELHQSLSPMFLVLPDTIASRDNEIDNIRRHLGMSITGPGT